MKRRALCLLALLTLVTPLAAARAGEDDDARQRQEAMQREIRHALCQQARQQASDAQSDYLSSNDPVRRPQLKARAEELQWQAFKQCGRD